MFHLLQGLYFSISLAQEFIIFSICPISFQYSFTLVADIF